MSQKYCQMFFETSKKNSFFHEKNFQPKLFETKIEFFSRYKCYVSHDNPWLGLVLELLSKIIYGSLKSIQKYSQMFFET